MNCSAPSCDATAVLQWSRRSPDNPEDRLATFGCEDHKVDDEAATWLHEPECLTGSGECACVEPPAAVEAGATAPSATVAPSLPVPPDGRHA